MSAWLAWTLRGRARRGLIVLTFTILAVGLFIALLAETVNVASGPRGMDLLPTLESEFAAIATPADASLLNPPHSSSKMTQALVDAEYKTRLNYEVVRAHYDQEAARQGWSVCGERHVYDWFRDLGGKDRAYCKGDLHADLRFKGAREGYPWDYALSVSWGLEPLNDSGVAGGDHNVTTRDRWVGGLLGLLLASVGIGFALGARWIQATSIRFFERNSHLKFSLRTGWPEGRSLVPVLRLFGSVAALAGALLAWIAIFLGE